LEDVTMPDEQRPESAPVKETTERSSGTTERTTRETPTDKNPPPQNPPKE
jgi:hypothetical protein